MGRYPRGIAISPNGNAAYVGIMGGNYLVRVDLGDLEDLENPVGSGPRALEIDPSGRRPTPR